MINANEYRRDIIELYLKNGWTDVAWVYDDVYGGIYMGGVSPKTGKWEHIEVESEKSERSYCWSCRSEMITESDRICDKCKIENALVQRTESCKNAPVRKPILYCDMDQVLCDFKSAQEEDLIKTPLQKFPQSQFGFFLKLKPIEFAITTVKILNRYFDIHILTRPSIYNLNSYSEKALWIQNHLGFEYLDKLIMSCDKSLLKGDYLVNDSTSDGQLDFEGELIRFGSEQFPDWLCVQAYLMANKRK